MPNTRIKIGIVDTTTRCPTTGAVVIARRAHPVSAVETTDDVHGPSIVFAESAERYDHRLRRRYPEVPIGVRREIVEAVVADAAGTADLVTWLQERGVDPSVDGLYLPSGTPSD